MNRQRSLSRGIDGKLAVLIASFAAALLLATGLFSTQQAWALDDAQKLAAGTLQVQASPAKGKTFKVAGNTYKVTDAAHGREWGEVVLVKYGAKAKSVTVNTVKYKGYTYEVEAIGKNAFNNAKGHKVTTVKLSKHVDEIGAKAFYGCSKLKLIDMSKCDVIDIDRGKRGYYLDEVDIGKQAFTKAGTASVKVKCGSNNATYRKLFKKALNQKGMRKSVSVVK